MGRAMATPHWNQMIYLNLILVKVTNTLYEAGTTVNIFIYCWNLRMMRTAETENHSILIQPLKLGNKKINTQIIKMINFMKINLR